MPRLFALLFLLAAFFVSRTVLAEKPPKKETSFEAPEPSPLEKKYLYNIDLRKPEDLTDELRSEMFGHCPADMQGPLWDKLLKYHDTLRAEWKLREELDPFMPEDNRLSLVDFGELGERFDSISEFLLSDLFRRRFFYFALAFGEYPEMENPADEESYWGDSAREFDDYFDFLIDSSLRFQDQLRDLRKHVETLEKEGKKFLWRWEEGGEKELVFSARKPTANELAEAEKLNVDLVCTPFGRDALVFVQNRFNPVRNLILEQIRGIFSGKHTRWNEVGGFGGKLTPLTRNANSGSQELMLQLVMKDLPFGKNASAHETASMIGIYDNLQYEEGGIGYSVFYYERFMVASPFTRTISVDGVSPTRETIASGEYPLCYDNYVIRCGETHRRIEAILGWLLSNEGQRVIQTGGYDPVQSE